MLKIRITVCVSALNTKKHSGPYSVQQSLSLFGLILALNQKYICIITTSKSQKYLKFMGPLSGPMPGIVWFQMTSARLALPEHQASCARLGQPKGCHPPLTSSMGASMVSVPTCKSTMPGPHSWGTNLNLIGGNLPPWGQKLQRAWTIKKAWEICKRYCLNFPVCCTS